MLAAAAAIDGILGLELLAAAGRRSAAAASESDVDEDVRRLVKQREDARKRRDFATADRIRDELLAEGIVLEDSADGTRWKRAG